MSLTQAVAVASSNAEPIVTTALIAGAGLVLLWFANRFMKMLAMMQSVTTALFGDMNVSEHERNGALKQLAGIDKRLIDHAGGFDHHVQEEASWQREMYEAIHKWNEATTAILANVTPVPPPPLQLPPPIERRRKPRGGQRPG